MLIRRTFQISAVALFVLLLAAPVRSAEPIPVVATFSILGDMVKRIGAEHVTVTTLVGPDGDTHVYQPTPADARAISDAAVLVVNGLQFEGWLDRLIDASDFEGLHVVATDGIEPIAFDDDGDSHGEDHDADHDDHGHDDHDDADHDGHDEGEHDEHAEDDHGHDDHDGDSDGEDHDAGHDDHDGDSHDEDHDAGHDDHDESEHDEHAEDDHDEHVEADGHHHHGEFDPHAWQSLHNAVVYADNIAAALVTADPENADVFEENRAAYAAELEALDAEIREIVAGLPSASRTVVTSHDAFQYFGQEYGLTFIAPQGISTEAEASAKDVARLIEQIRHQGIRAVFIENIGDARLLSRIAEETGAVIGGTLYPGALSGPEGPAPTYLDMMHYNATTLAEALTR